ncbi:unnamed protein product [Nyctereutes procyonoides]|uniref:(raccoon dog) hypothetical protein n=1 Tax=Nyctereutes procyonoides TaxID=34880 RepID=A0A811YKZ1_NYCPR|nr:unnamed protein product [Nyctereutes procyonoides]
MTGCLLIRNKYPNFEANTIIGHIHFYDFLRDLTTVCIITKLGRAANIALQFKMLPFLIIDDKNQEFTILLGILGTAEKTIQGIPMTASVILYLATTGRNFDEILKVVISFKLTLEKTVDTLANLRNENRVMGVFTEVLPSDKKDLRYTLHL